MREICESSIVSQVRAPAGVPGDEIAAGVELESLAQADVDEDEARELRE